MGRLDEVKSWMGWWGWTNYGNPGSVKRDAHDVQIARHGDETWKSDVEQAIELEARLSVKRREH